MRTLVTLGLALLFALSGCVSDGESNDGDLPSESPGDADGDGHADPKVLDQSGSITAGGGSEVTGSVRLGTAATEFSVSKNVTLMFVELAWESPAVALDLCIHAPADGVDAAGYPICGETIDGGSAGMPKNLVTYARVAPAEGTGWIVDTFSDGPAADQPYTVKITLFFGETSVPDGYSALA